MKKFHNWCACIHTSYDTSEPNVIFTFGSHSHASASAEIDVQKAMHAMKDKVGNCGASTTKH